MTFNGLHGVIPQNIEVFITTAVRTSNAIRDFSLINSVQTGLRPIQPPLQ
jgi:hypothetical protein